MSKRKIGLIILVGLFAFLAWLFWPTNAKKAVGDTSSANHQAQPHFPTQSSIGDKNPPKENLNAQMREMMNDANRPIAFYGLVIDQDRNPISGVKVTLQIRRTIEIGTVGIRDAFDYLSLITGSDGQFALTDAKGAVLVVKSLEKAGYEPSEKATRGMYWYWREPKDAYRPNSKQPEIFHMWKKAGAEELIFADKFYGIEPDGRVYAIDLVGHKKNEGGSVGDFKVSLRRPTQISADEKFDWSCIIEAIGGGVIATNEEQMYRAPENGYLPRFEVKMSASDPQWSDRAKFQFYLKSRDGRIYARIAAEAFANYRNKAVFSVKYFVNPSGSRNLEFDPLQNVERPSK